MLSELTGRGSPHENLPNIESTICWENLKWIFEAFSEIAVDPWLMEDGPTMLTGFNEKSSYNVPKRVCRLSHDMAPRIIDYHFDRGRGECG